MYCKDKRFICWKHLWKDHLPETLMKIKDEKICLLIWRATIFNTNVCNAYVKGNLPGKARQSLQRSPANRLIWWCDTLVIKWQINKKYWIDWLSTVVTVSTVYFLSAFPLKTEGVSFRAMDYSPLLGGFAVVLADGRGGFLSAETAIFDCSVS